ncbi:hypothetical protein ABIB60_000083 [Hymenobacter sp. UYP22]
MSIDNRLVHSDMRWYKKLPNLLEGPDEFEISDFGNVIVAILAIGDNCVIHKN